MIQKLHKIDPADITMKSNLTRKEQEAYNQLKALSKSTIEIKKADKSDTWVIMNKEDYRQMILKEHLFTETYEKAPADSNIKVYRKLVKLVKNNRRCLTKDEVKYICDDDWNDANFYGLPKLHKCKEVTERIEKEDVEYLKMVHPASLKTRPICGGPKAVTQGGSKLLHEILSPLVPEMKSYIKDEWDFVRTLPQKVSFRANLVSCDIVSLYSSIPTELGMEALEYWIERLRSKIPSRFTKSFILELAKFVLENNYCKFDSEMFRQVIGTAMGTIFAPPYACLVIGYLEETKLFPRLLPSKFSPETCQKIIEFFYRFMDDGTTLLPIEVDLQVFLSLLNSMHPSIKYTISKPMIIRIDGLLVQMLVFLSLLIHLSGDGNIWTNVHYKPTNTHEYLNFDSHHPDHVKSNIPYVLAKRIVVFTSKDHEMRKNLEDLRVWLQNCGYPKRMIQDGFHNAQLQGPAPPKKVSKVIPLISTYCNNYDNRSVMQMTKSLLKNPREQRLKDAFENVTFINAYKQPPNLLRSLSNSKFERREENQITGVFKCKEPKCKICRLYLQVGTEVPMSDGSTWEIRCFANCNSLNVLYFLVCNFCGIVSKIGKTDNCRDRTNNHITGCRHGTQTDDFDNHVFECGPQRGMNFEPYFKLYILMVCSNYHKLLSYESSLHAQGLDTINHPNQTIEL